MRLWRSLPLSFRVPLLVAALMVAVAIVASQLVLGALDRQQQMRIRELARLHVEALSVALGPHVLRKDVWEIYDTLERAAGVSEGSRTVFSAVADPKGRILAATDPRRAPVDSQLAGLSKGAQPPDNLSVANDENNVKLLAPLSYQGRQVGQILTELDISDLVQERKDARRYLLLGNAITTAFLVILGYLATRRMLMPIGRLVAWMRDTEGAPRPIPDDDVPQGDNELAQLVRTYNDMACAVSAKSDTEKRLAERERFVSLGRLSSSLAHEINNPLGGLLNATDTIREYADRPDVVRQSADLISRGLKHLRDVAKATLDMNRFERSEMSLSAEDFEDLRLLIGPEVRMNAQQMDWEVEVEDSEIESLPAAQVRQITLNLLLNASQAAGKEGRIGLGVRTREHALIIEVSDSGPGLSDSARARLLDSGPVPSSEGVGLRLVRELVSGFGGGIEVVRENSVTCIRISLPLGDEVSERC